MTEGEWMGDRWSMMLSLKKKAYEERKKKMFLFASLSLTHIHSLSLSFTIRRKREKEKSKSYPLHLKQINLISSLIFFFFSTIYNQIKKRKSTPCAEKNFRF
jgi:hypothetical protein